MPRRIYWTNVSINTKVVVGYLESRATFRRELVSNFGSAAFRFRSLGPLVSDQSALTATAGPVGAASREPRSISMVAKA